MSGHSVFQAIKIFDESAHRRRRWSMGGSYSRASGLGRWSGRSTHHQPRRAPPNKSMVLPNNSTLLTDWTFDLKHPADRDGSSAQVS